MKINKYIVFFGVLTSFLLLSSCETNSIEYKKSEIKNTRLLDFFKEENKNCTVITVGEKDINNDEKEDMVVIFKHNDNSHGHIGEVEFTVVINDDNPKLLKHYKAPVENQKIEFKDVDKKQPIEFIISGSKNSNIGYSIYRFENNEVIDIFGSGSMDAC